MSLIDQLLDVYPSIILTNPTEIEHPDDYKWFETPSKESIGIKKEELDGKEGKLLSLFLTPLSSEDKRETNRDQEWFHYLKGTRPSPPEKFPRRYRFVFFSIADLPMNQDTFQEAFQSLFPEHMPIFFESDYEGFIIEEYFSENHEILTFQEIIDVLMSDFYTKIRFYISEFSESVEGAPAIFKWAEASNKIAEKFQFSTVATFKDIIPYHFIDALSPEQWAHVKRSLFQDVKEEEDLLNTIKVFLESGSNATLAAKTLYMHRNSLQYRVDKFSEKTGLDVKQFDHAVTTYLALLLLDQ